MAGATAPPTTAKSTVSLGPLYQQATDEAKAAVQPQIDALNSQQAGADATAKQRGTDAQNAGDAASSLIASLIKPVSGAYEAAGQNQELAANGFSQGLQDALKGNTDNLNSILGKLNSPATLDSHASEAGDMLYSLGGYNPGTSFSKQGASAAAGLAGTASSANLLGLENAKSVKAQALLADQDFQNKIANIAATLPGQIETNYQKLQSLALSSAKFAEQVKNDKFNEAAKTASQNLAVDKFNTSTQLSVARLNQQARQFAVRQSNSDRSYQLSLAHLGIAQKNLQMKIAANAFTQAHGGYSVSQVRGFNQKLDALVSTAAPTHPQNTPGGAAEPAPQYRDTSGKWHDITANSVIPKNAPTRGTSTYGNFITAALKKGVPIQLALQRADSIWPETQRDIPDSLKNLPAVAAEAAQQTSDYNQTTGNYSGMRFKASGLAGGFLPHGAQVTIGRSDQGRDIQTSPGMPIIAPGAGYVVRIASDPGGGGAHFGPSYPIVKFTSGPYAGKTMYIGHTTALVKPGQKFKVGTSLSVTGNGGPESGGAPPGWAEIGFAPNGSPGSMTQVSPF